MAYYSGDDNHGEARIYHAGRYVVVKAVFERKSSDSSGRDSSWPWYILFRNQKKIRSGMDYSDRGIITGAVNSIANDGYSHGMQDDHGWWSVSGYQLSERPSGVVRHCICLELINGSWWAFDEKWLVLKSAGWVDDATWRMVLYRSGTRWADWWFWLFGGAWYISTRYLMVQSGIGKSVGTENTRRILCRRKMAWMQQRKTNQPEI